MKKVVGVIFGGQSREHGVSIVSGTNVADNLDPNKYEVVRILINLNGSWEITNKSWPQIEVEKEYVPKFDKQQSLLNAFEILRKIDIVFVLLHGPFGEDGTIQGLLELANVPYTGSGVLASALGMDKVASKLLFQSAGIKTPRYVTAHDKEIPKLPFLPAVVKPVNQGSTVGVSIITSEKQLKKALEKSAKISNHHLIEEFIEGKEVTCAVIGTKTSATALPIVEVVPKVSGFFDYRAKYASGGSEEICPARLDTALTRKVQEIAVKVFRVLGCSGIARIDMIISGEEIFVLELNSIPGLTPASLVPKELKAAGISFSDFLDQQIEITQKK